MLALLATAAWAGTVLLIDDDGGLRDALSDQVRLSVQSSAHSGPPPLALLPTTPDVAITHGDAAARLVARVFPGIALVALDATHPPQGAHSVAPSRDWSAAASQLRALDPGVRSIALLGVGTGSLDARRAIFAKQGIEVEVHQLVSGADAAPIAELALSRADWLWLDDSLSALPALSVSRIIHQAVLRGKPVLGYRDAQLQGAPPAAAVLHWPTFDLTAAAASTVRALLSGTALPATSLPPSLHANANALRAGGVIVNKRNGAIVKRWVE